MHITVCLVGRSGVGKTSLARELVDKHDFAEIVSCTTREPREGEEHGVDYFFMHPEEFDLHFGVEGDYVEKIEFGGNKYGLHMEQLEQAQRATPFSVVVMTAEGAEELVEVVGAANVFVVELKASSEVLAERMRGQGRDEESIKARLAIEHAQVPEGLLNMTVLTDTMSTEDLCNQLAYVVRVERDLRAKNE